MTAAGANAAPVVLPELREWVGGSGSFAASAAMRVVYGDASLKAMAEDFANDYQALTGVRLQVATAPLPRRATSSSPSAPIRPRGSRMRGTCST